MAPPWRLIQLRKLVRFVAAWEGFPSTQPYNDPVGHCTVGYGRLLHFGPCTAEDIRKWRGITKKQARKMLRRDLRPYRRAVRGAVKRRISTRELDALTSWTYNVGVGGMQGSTLIRRVNSSEGSKRKARKRIYAQELPRWNKAGGGELPGLTKRRAAEVRIANRGDYGGRP